MIFFFRITQSVLNSYSSTPASSINPDLGGMNSGQKGNIASNIQKTSVLNDKSGKVGREVLSGYKGLETNKFNPKVTNKSEIKNSI